MTDNLSAISMTVIVGNQFEFGEVFTSYFAGEWNIPTTIFIYTNTYIYCSHRWNWVWSVMWYCISEISHRILINSKHLNQWTFVTVYILLGRQSTYFEGMEWIRTIKTIVLLATCVYVWAFVAVPMATTALSFHSIFETTTNNDVRIVLTGFLHFIPYHYDTQNADSGCYALLSRV